MQAATQKGARTPWPAASPPSNGPKISPSPIMACNKQNCFTRSSGSVTSATLAAATGYVAPSAPANSPIGRAPRRGRMGPDEWIFVGGEYGKKKTKYNRQSYN